MRSNPFASSDGGAFPGVLAAHLFRTLPPMLTLVPELAADDEPPPAEFDGSSWVIRVQLNSGFTWSDGEAIDAFDVEYTFDEAVRLGAADDLGWAVADPNGPADLLSVTAVDAATVDIRFSGPPGIDRWHFGVATAAILPEHYWLFTFADRAEGRERDSELGMTAPSAGGYRLDRATEDGGWTWAAVDSWWNAGAEYTVYEDGTVLYRNSLLGIDEAYGGPTEGPVAAAWVEGPFAGAIRWQPVAKGRWPGTLVPELADLVDGGLVRISGTPVPAGAIGFVSRETTVTSIVFNPTTPALANPLTRRALACLLEPSVPANEIVGGGSIRSGWDSGIGQWHNAASDDPCMADGGERRDIAAELLTAAGWSLGDGGVPPTSAQESASDNGLSHPDGLSSMLTLFAPGSVGDPGKAATALWAKSLLEAAGFEVLILEGDAALRDAVEWDLAVVSQSTGPIPRPYLAETIDPALRHLDAGTLAEAWAIWAAGRTAITRQALATPLYALTTVDLVRAGLTLPYESALGGLDPAAMATSIRQTS